MNKRAEKSSEMLISYHSTTWHHTSENLNLNIMTGKRSESGFRKGNDFRYATGQWFSGVTYWEGLSYSGF
jgi:hypothetical protein